jgi:hypothetical protein
MSLQSGVGLLSFFAGAGTAISLYSVLHRYARFRWRTIDDVAEVMRPPDYGLLDDLSLSAETLAIERWTEYLALTGSRRQRRAKLDKLAEQYERCYHNSRVNKDWAGTEWHDMLMLQRQGSEYDANSRLRIRELLEAATQACWDLRIILILIQCWGLLHTLQLDRLDFFSLPETAEVRNLPGRDVLQSYERLKLAIAGMATIYPEENCQDILARM